MPTDPPVHEFGTFRFDPREARLQRGDAQVNLEPKAMAVLTQLVTHPGHLFAREELLDAVWGHRCVTPSTLSRIITVLRGALDDDAAHPRFIETVPRRGYRFIAEQHMAQTEPVALPQRRISDTLFRPPPLPSRVETLLPRPTELASLHTLLRNTRLLSLIGPGGIGKTRLALEFARALKDEFRDGVWLADLTPCRNAAEVADVLSSRLGLGKSQQPIESLLARALRGREALLILDNCERVAPACAAIVEALLRACDGVRVLTTSQLRLGAEGEQVYVVPTMSLPDEAWYHAEDPLAAARESDAVRLLELRAREADPHFELDRDNVAAAVALCGYLDGLPLALELAASRVHVLGMQPLLERLRLRREVLMSDRRNVPDRQRTLRDMLDWSYQLLSPDESKLLQRLALFSGGWTLEAAEAVMSDDECMVGGVVDVLTSLVDKNFAVVEPKARPRRFHLLESVRDYALEKLAGDPTRHHYRARMLDYYLALSRRADAVLYEQPEHEYAHWLDHEQSNLRLMYEFALSHDRAPQALELALNLRWFWWLQGGMQRALDWIQQALASIVKPDPVARARALQFIGMMEMHMSRDPAESVLAEAVAATGQVGLRREHSYALSALAMNQITSGDLFHGRRSLSHAIREAIAIGDAQALAYALIWAASMQSGRGKHRLGRIASKCAVDGLTAFWRERGTQPGFLLGFAQINFAAQSFFLGEISAAARALDHAMALAASLRNLRMSAGALEGFAYLMHGQGAYALAARLLGHAQGLRELTGVPLSRYLHDTRQRVWKELQERMGDEAQALADVGRMERIESLQAALQAHYPALGLDARAAA